MTIARAVSAPADTTSGKEVGMPSGIQVTPEELQQVSSQLMSGASNIDGILSQLRSQVEPLRSSWVGAAQAQFEQFFQDWQRAGQTLHQSLTGLGQQTAQAAVAYADTEQSVAASFGGR
jgi:6 kDa early secretory antigenic target